MTPEQAKDLIGKAGTKVRMAGVSGYVQEFSPSDQVALVAFLDNQHRWIRLWLPVAGLERVGNGPGWVV